MSEVSPRLVEGYLSAWVQRGLDPNAQREYVAQELHRLQEDGEPLLTAVLMSSLEIQQALGLSVLWDEFQHVTFKLRLHNGIVAPDEISSDGVRMECHAPPERDPDGKLLPEGERGKVLHASIGPRGGEINNSHRVHESVTGKFTGPNRNTMHARGEPLHNVVKLYRDRWTDVTLPNAITILRQWGVGIPASRFYVRTRRMQVEKSAQFPTGLATEEFHQDTWLVEEYNRRDHEKDFRSRADAERETLEDAAYAKALETIRRVEAKKSQQPQK